MGLGVKIKGFCMKIKGLVDMVCLVWQMAAKKKQNRKPGNNFAAEGKLYEPAATIQEDLLFSSLMDSFSGTFPKYQKRKFVIYEQETHQIFSHREPQCHF